MTDYRTHITDTLQAKRTAAASKFTEAHARWKESAERNYMEPLKVLKDRQERDTAAAELRLIDDQLRSQGVSQQHSWRPDSFFSGSNF